MKEQTMGISESSHVFPWKYDIIWAAGNNSTLNIQKEEWELEAAIAEICINQELQLTNFKVLSQEISMTVKSELQLNLSKFLKAVQKAAKGIVDLSQFECVTISQKEDRSREDIRLMGILNHLWSGEYYDLDEGLDDEELKRLAAYLKGRETAVIELADQTYLIDIKGMAQEINLNCFACTKKYQYGCCCGAPCSFSEKNAELFDRHLIHMEEALKKLDKKQYDRLQENGGFMTANGKLKSFDGHCSLLIEEEGVYKCMAHKYALDTGIPPYEICPLSCLMYPLEIIELISNKKKRVILLTSAVEESFAKNFGRWGSYESLQVDLGCIHKEKHNEMFIKEDYQPVYEVAKGLLRHEFGSLFYAGIKKLMDENKTEANLPK